MARNRKYQSAAMRFGPPVKAFLLCLLIGGSGVGYVWQKDQISQLGQQIKKRETCLRDLTYQNDKLAKQLAFMRSPLFLESKIRELKLGLARPDQAQVWRLPEPPREQPEKPVEPQFAARNGGTLSVP